MMTGYDIFPQQVDRY